MPRAQMRRLERWLLAFVVASNLLLALCVW